MNEGSNWQPNTGLGLSVQNRLGNVIPIEGHQRIKRWCGMLIPDSWLPMNLTLRFCCELNAVEARGEFTKPPFCDSVTRSGPHFQVYSYESKTCTRRVELYSILMVHPRSWVGAITPLKLPKISMKYFVEFTLLLLFLFLFSLLLNL